MGELLDLDRDLVLSEDDFIAMGNTPRQSPDLEAYLDFLAEVDAFEVTPPVREFYGECFEL
ncbi:MAG: hypothetical protein JXL84_05915 [Deltaproteobacteria bacterium]|nr:hypothetical protein [Deltaproteobacteria bacterium]